MMKNTVKIRSVGVTALVLLWATLVGFHWFGPRTEISEAERRPLAQMPEISMKNILSGKFMSEFEDFALDQFPLRDTFRQVKSLFHYNVLGQKDNNDIYLTDGIAVKQEYPYNPASTEHALERFNHLYEKYLKESGSDIYMAIVPDKGYYLAENAGNLAMDYEAMFEDYQQGMPWAQQVDLTDTLTGSAYYRTDTHWRQEHLLSAAQKLCQALGATAPRAEDFTLREVERPFYGVYYGQAALPMKPEAMYVMDSELLSCCQVYDFESGKYNQVYNMDKLTSRDLYDVFLSGSRSLLTIENPNAASDRELIIFRDSFGSSIAPLLVQEYAKVTLVDIRYLQIDLLGRFLEFNGQDVLFLYSTLVLNNSETIK
jgi:hypothetical protein